MLLIELIILTLLFPLISLANTETYQLTVPHYFDISPHPSPISEIDKFQRNITRINSTHSALLHYPILTKLDSSSLNLISLKYNSIEKPTNYLLVRINNYQDSTFKNDDLLFVKLCWPATYPYNFKINHQFLKLSDTVYTKHDPFDIYLMIEFSFDAHSYDLNYLNEQDDLIFQLYITKAPLKWLPIPLEMYYCIMYFVDISILVVTTIVPSLAYYALA